MPDIHPKEELLSVPRLFGLIGKPLGHSFSKRYFTEKFGQLGITDAAYELFPLESIEALPQLIAAYPNLKGLNVTIPYKQQVIPFLHDTTELPLQACNCIDIHNGRLKGFNTDVIGFETSFKEQLQPGEHRALILGTGGAAVAVQYVLGKLGIPFSIVSRKAADGVITYDGLNAATINDHDIIINTTPLGTFPDVDTCAELPYDAIGSGHYCYDLVYNPEKTLFLKRCEARGATIKNGGDMLALQAEANWVIWNRDL